jgi:hypothetical protein
MRFGFRVQNCRCKEAKIARGARNIQCARQRKRLARVDRFGARQFFQITLNQVGDTEQKFRSLCCGFFRPINKRLLCRRDSAFDVADVASRDLRIRFASRRLDIVEVFSADWLYELTVNEVLDLREFGAHVRV